VLAIQAVTQDGTGPNVSPHQPRPYRLFLKQNSEPGADVAAVDMSNYLQGK